MVNSAICSRCGDQDETFLHCVRDCTFSIIIWQRIDFASQPFFFSNSVTNWLQEGVKCSRTSVFFAALWWLWRHCNLMCLNETMSVTRLCSNIFSYAESISTSLCNPSSATAPARLIRWNSNNHMCTILNVDGTCNGDRLSAQVSVELFATALTITYLGFQASSTTLKTSCSLNLQHSIKV